MTDNLLKILVIVEQLDKLGEYILLKDFNLYYPIWNNLGRIIYYIITDILLITTKLQGLEITLL